MKWQITWIDDNDIMISTVSTKDMVLTWLAQKFLHLSPFLKIQRSVR